MNHKNSLEVSEVTPLYLCLALTNPLYDLFSCSSMSELKYA